MVFCLGLSEECNLSTCSMISLEALPASSGGVPTAIACSAQTYTLSVPTLTRTPRTCCPKTVNSLPILSEVYQF